MLGLFLLWSFKCIFYFLLKYILAYSVNLRRITCSSDTFIYRSVIAITVIISTSITLHSDPFTSAVGIIQGYLEVDREGPDCRE